MTKKTTKQVLREILNETLALDYAAQSIIGPIKQDLQRDGAPLEFDERTYEGYASKLADLRLLHLLIGFFGLETYREVLMATEIERMFGVKPQSGAPDKIMAAQKALNDAASLLLAPDESGGTPLDNRAVRRAKATARRAGVSASPSAAGSTAKQGPDGRSGASTGHKVPKPR